MAGTKATGPRETSPTAPALPTAAQAQNHPQLTRCHSRSDGEEYAPKSDKPRATLRPINLVHTRCCAVGMIDKHELAKSYKRLVRLLLERGNAVVVGGLDVITAQAVVRLPLGRGSA